MESPEQLKENIVDILVNYDKCVCTVGGIVENSLNMLEQQRQAERLVHDELRETFAKAGSLRKKDFDMLMAPVWAYQERKEQEIRRFLTFFLEEQRTLAGRLKEMVQTGALKEPGFEKSLEQAIEEAKAYFIKFQQEQSFIQENMQNLFHKKESLTLKEFKRILGRLLDNLGLEHQKISYC